MVIGFYNVGVAEEALEQYEAATEAFRNAVALGEKYLPPNKQVTKLAKKALEDVKLAKITSKQNSSFRPMSSAEF
jgi:hypothetical protein